MILDFAQHSMANSTVVAISEWVVPGTNQADVPCSVRMLSIFSTFDSDNMSKLTISPQAKRAQTDRSQGTPTRAHFQPPEPRPE